MIVIKMELWPGGDEGHAIDLGRCVIGNDVVRSLESGLTLGDYDVRIEKGEMYSRRPGDVWKKGHVTGFKRSSRQVGPWELLFHALKNTLGRRVDRALVEDRPKGGGRG